MNQVDYDSEMLERVRDECGDFLKSLELNLVEISELVRPDTCEGLGEAISNVKVREIGPVNSKSTLDKEAARNAKVVRLRSGSRTKDDNRAPWDPHHRQCMQDTMATLKQDNQAKQLQVSKLSTENSQLKKRIIDLKLEM